MEGDVYRNPYENELDNPQRVESLKLIPNKQLHITPDTYNLVKHYGVIVVIDVVPYDKLVTEDSLVQDVLVTRPYAVHEAWVRFAYESSPTLDEDDKDLWLALPVAYFLRRTTLLG